MSLRGESYWGKVGGGKAVIKRGCYWEKPYKETLKSFITGESPSYKHPLTRPYKTRQISNKQTFRRRIFRWYEKKHNDNNLFLSRWPYKYYRCLSVNRMLAGNDDMERGLAVLNLSWWEYWLARSTLVLYEPHIFANNKPISYDRWSDDSTGDGHLPPHDYTLSPSGTKGKDGKFPRKI